MLKDETEKKKSIKKICIVKKTTIKRMKINFDIYEKTLMDDEIMKKNPIIKINSNIISK
jgi:hypothetical protein